MTTKQISLTDGPGAVDTRSLAALPAPAGGVQPGDQGLSRRTAAAGGSATATGSADVFRRYASVQRRMLHWIPCRQQHPIPLLPIEKASLHRDHYLPPTMDPKVSEMTPQRYRFFEAAASILEVCLDRLYEGQAGFEDLMQRLREHGLAYAGNLDQAHAPDGHVVYLDAVLVRC